MKLTQRIEKMFDDLWPICRSITGPGYRKSLDILSTVMPTKRIRFETDLKVFDWTIPKEWLVRDAYLLDPLGKKRAKFKDNNLHLVGYSVPFKGRMSLAELKPHLYSLPDQPEAIPYVTSYYRETWGFCISNQELESLPEGDYEIFIDTELKPGCVEIGEAVLPGNSSREIFFSTYLCHPSMANDNLSGPLVTAFLYEYLEGMKDRQYTYRFVILPETIGSIAFLKERGEHLRQFMDAGYVVSCAGDAGLLTYKSSRRGDALADRAARLVLKDIGEHRLEPFKPLGSDERQYCSPGFNLPVGSLMRTMDAECPQYHTSFDNKDFISFDALVETIEVCYKICSVMEANWIWKSNMPFCEPQLSQKGLFRDRGAKKKYEDKVEALMWFLNLADGKHDLLDIVEQSSSPINLLIEASIDAEGAGLVSKSGRRQV